MINHWEHTEIVTSLEYSDFAKHGIPVTPKEALPFNTAVYVTSSDGDKPLEGIYDPDIKGIRLLKDTKSPNRDLRLYRDALLTERITMLAIDGLMGVGKTSTAIEFACDKYLKDIKVPSNIPVDTNLSKGQHKLIIAKPYVNAGGEEYGFLPGDIDEKITPTIRNFTQYIDRNHQSSFESLKDAGFIEILPLGFVRGMDADNVTIIADECQNTKELISLATRKAKDSRIFFLGDTSPFQIDRKGNTPTENGLVHLVDLLRGAPYFQYIEMKSLQHVLRSTEVRDVVRRLLKKNGKNPQEWVVNE